jgi:type II secretory pathway pseudopilin PulG
MMKKSVKCSQCGFVGWADAENCKKCGASFIQPSTDGSYQPPSDSRYQAGGRGGFNGQVKKGLAICALVLGIINLFSLGILGIGAIVGIILSIVALSKIKRDPSRYGGKGFAIAGLITSILGVLVLVPVGLLAAIIIPNVMAAARSANEASARQSMRQISAAEATYQSDHGLYGRMDQLLTDRLIDADLATATRRGYRFTVQIPTTSSSSQPGYHAVGMPTQYPNSGRRSFFIDESGIIRAADAQGAEATEFDPPVNVHVFDPSQPGNETSDRY